MNSEGVKLPIFNKITCLEEDNSFSLCVTVHYNDEKDSHDLILAQENPKAQTVFKGHLKSNMKTKVVIILKDDFNEEDTVRKIYWPYS